MIKWFWTIFSLGAPDVFYVILGESAECLLVQYKNIFAAVRKENQSNRLTFRSAHWWKVLSLVLADTYTFTDRLMQM